MKELNPNNVVSFRRVEQARPFVNGICFDDLWGMPASVWDLLYQREVVYCTSFEIGGERYGGHIIARSWDHAREVAAWRGLGETVDGVIGGQIQA